VPPKKKSSSVIRHTNMIPVKFLIANLDAVYPTIFAEFSGDYFRKEILTKMENVVLRKLLEYA